MKPISLSAFKIYVFNVIFNIYILIVSDALSNLSNVKKFLNFIPELKYLRMKLCEKLIKQLIKVSSRKYSVLTLKDIVSILM